MAAESARCPPSYMGLTVPPDIEAHYYVSFILGSLGFCRDCQREPDYASAYPLYTDENYFDQAIAMKRGRWVVSPSEKLDVLCPECAAGARIS